jgi:putative oxidoreductase
LPRFALAAQADLRPENICCNDICLAYISEEENVMRTTRLDLGLLALRLALGVVFVMHGGQKLFVLGPGGVAGFLGSLGVPFPAVNAWLVIAAELGGGLALLAGALTRLAGLATALTMIVAMTTVHLANGFFLPAGYEFTLTLLLASVAIVLTGPGAFSVDALISRKPSTGLPAHPAAPTYHRAA